MTRRALVPALALLALLAPSASAAPDDVSFEAESMSYSTSNAWVYNVGDASGGQALQFRANGTATKAVTATRSSIHLFVRARGDADLACDAPPRISVKIGSKEWYTGPVSTTGWAWIGVRVSVPSGSHTVSVSFTNDKNEWVGPLRICDRNAWVDQLTLVATPFSPTGWRNQPLADSAPIKPNSALLRDEIVDQVRDSLAMPSPPQNAGAWVNTTSYAAPVYVVPPGHPTVRVDDPENRAALQAQWDAVPIPADAKPSQGADAELTVYQPSTNTLWDFMGMRKDGNGNWVAHYGGRMTNVSQHQGHFEDPPLGPGRGYGATATSIAFLAGMQRIEELRRGVIDHAVDFGVMTPRGRDGWCWPAQRTDRSLASREPQAIPAGTRFRLPATLNVDALPLTNYAKIVARAVQRYGMVARDSAGLHVFYAENPTPLGADPYGTIFENRYPNARPGGALENFPWDQLQVVEQPAGTTCQDDPDVD